MPELKYFRIIKAAQQHASNNPGSHKGPFDFDSLGTKSRLARFLVRFALRRLLPFLTAILRRIWPNPRFGRVIIVTRRSDCEEVLGDMERFPVVYRPEMRELGHGEDNILSLDGEMHYRMREILKDAFTPEDIENTARWTRESAQNLLKSGGGRIDVMRDLITRTAAEVSGRLFGLSIHDHPRFAEWTMAVSTLLFGDFFGDKNVRKQALIARDHLHGLIMTSVARHRAMGSTVASADRPDNRSTLIGRLIEASLSDEQICATILGLITAFVPTNTLAAGNIFEVLRDNYALRRKAQRAVSQTGQVDHQELEAVLLEAARLNPALSPGIWRHRRADATATLIGKGSRGVREVRPGDLVLCCVPSALRDRSGKKWGEQFSRKDAWMIFGSGPHDCIGARLALAHITSVFATLYALPRLRPAPGKHGKELFRTGPYPTRYDMVWDDPTAKRANLLAAIPVESAITQEQLESEIRDKLGNPMKPEIAKLLDQTDHVMFASLSVVEAEPGSDRNLLLVELTGDGGEEAVATAFAESTHAWLAETFAHCDEYGKKPPSAEKLARRILDHAFTPHRWPWGTTGLHFDGLPGLSVRDIARQGDIARFAREQVNSFLGGELSDGSRAMDVLLRTRRLIRQDALYHFRPELAQNMRDAASYQFDIVRPSRERPAIAGWTPPKSSLAPFWSIAKSNDGWPVLAILAGVWLIFSASLLNWLAPNAGEPVQAWGWPVVASVLGGLVISLLGVGAALGLFIMRLRWHEKRDWSDPRIAELDHVRKVSAAEDVQGLEQNHIIAVMPLKRGLLRRLTFAFSMWWIKQAVSYFFRPGFVATMGTIHKARWCVIPGTRQFVFFSNYDGSWESYLEDFITRAHEGQTSAWTHGQGFPPTRMLIRDGARHGDRFKRWVRRQQRVTAAWYSRFPRMTAKQIRNNAMILDGLAHATTDTDARRWLALFGSAQMQTHELESQEIQSLVFTGFGAQKRAIALLLELPENPTQLREWLELLSGVKIPRTLKNLALGQLLEADTTLEAGTKPLSLSLAERIRFGDQSAREGGAILGLTARGLAKAGLDEACGLDQFPATFRQGATGRAGRLGDPPPSDWRFGDTGEAELEGSPGCDAVLLLYGTATCADSTDALGPDYEAKVTKHRALLSFFGVHVLHEVPCKPPIDEDDQENPYIEHFGFRDGISQPIIRGSRRARPDIPARDLLQPGEFLLGYRNEQGFRAPPLGVGTEFDPLSILPSLAASEPNTYPRFGKEGGHVRDFGRNGTFLVLRQLDQDVGRFWDNVRARVNELCKRYRSEERLNEVTGTLVNEEWMAAKIVGRWRNGSPLVSNPAGPAADDSPDSLFNDFAFGVDDPRGIACPLGAHIRRANPRDSLEPGDPEEQAITNRHRLIRRGRTYDYVPDRDCRENSSRKGLLFMAICADIERQFEFVQRSWINATSFHGLENEHDPLLEAGGNAGAFTIPTSFGPLNVPATGRDSDFKPYVTLRGAAYFFLPSRASLRFLISRLH